MDTLDESISIRVKESYASDTIGFILQSLEMGDGIMTYKINKTFPIALNENLSYIIVSTDPKLQLYTSSNMPFPRQLMTLKPHVGIVDVRIQVSIYIFYLDIYYKRYIIGDKT